jgi:hypothetical protein
MEEMDSQRYRRRGDRDGGAKLGECVIQVVFLISPVVLL